MADFLDVSDITPRISYTVGATPQTVFPVPFVFFEDVDLHVYVDGVEKTLATHFTVENELDEDGGTVTFLSAQSNCTVLVVRSIAIELLTHIPTFGPLDVPAINLQFSRFVAIQQELLARFGRSLVLSESSSSRDLTLPDPSAGRYLRWKTDLTGLENAVPSTGGGGGGAGDQVNYATQTLAAADTIDAAVLFLRTAGLANIGDGDGAVYKRVNSQPVIAARFRSVDRFLPDGSTDSANGGWWQIADDELGINLHPSCGRLTLTSGVPVTESDVSGTPYVYLTPTTNGNVTFIRTAARWVRRQFNELTLTLDATGHAAATRYGVWEYWDGSSVQIGTNILTSYAVVDGRPVSATDMVLRNNSINSSIISAGQASLRGVIETTLAGLTEDSYAKRLVSNVFNATPRKLRRNDPATTWDYTSSTDFQQAHGNALNQVRVVSCLAGRAVSIHVAGAVINNSPNSRTCQVGIGINSTTVDSSTVFAGAQATNAMYQTVSADYDGVLSEGTTTFVWIERGGGAGGGSEVQTWVGTAGLSRSGIIGTIYQ